MKKLTAKQIAQKHKGKYVEIYECPLWDLSKNGERLFEVRNTYSEIHENTTRAEDVGTELAFTR